MDPRRIRTLADLLHAMLDSVTVLSTHAQHAAVEPRASADEGADDLRAIVSEAEHIASFVALVPPVLAETVLRTLEMRSKDK